ncbi:hypothetical protein RclHR1_03240021 [Rhizophagus clarus]|nr:hypothetical protein RclHR1_03240021 [Rhizophagus clarus]
MYLDSGNIKVYETPLPFHARTAGKIIGLMTIWNGQDFDYASEKTLILGLNIERKPDCMIAPIYCPRPAAGQASSSTRTAYPTMIVLSIKIFGVRADNTIALTASLYLRTSPTSLIPIMIISFGTAGIDTSIVNYINGIGVLPGNLIGVGFTDPNNNNNNYPSCNVANIPTYLLNIPGAALFNEVSAPLRPVEFAAGFTLDLWELQVVIRRQLNI